MTARAPSGTLPGMKKALRDLFSSKKFLVMLAALAAYAGARVGLDVSQAEAEKVLGVVAVWLGAQGLADLGKGKGKAQAEVDAGSEKGP